MRCVHETPIDGNAVKCAVLAARVAGPANPNYPCDRCRAEWSADVPPDPADRTTWTPTLLAFVEPFAEQLPANPRGLGDTVALGLQALGIRKRRGCRCGKRQRWLNELVPYAD